MSHPEGLPRITIRVNDRGKNEQFEFRSATIRVGRRTANQDPPDLPLDDRTTSRSQALIRWQGRNYWITDCGSLTGTRVDGKRLSPGEQLALYTGTKVEFGESSLVIDVERSLEQSEFDVFLCHSNADKVPVREIAAALRKNGVNPWLDEDELLASNSFIVQMSQALESIKAAIVIWGPNSPGRWQAKEIEYLQMVAIQEHVRVIPVILQGVSADPTWPVFMDLLQRVDFRKTNQDPMAQLLALLS